MQERFPKTGHRSGLYCMDAAKPYIYLLQKEQQFSCTGIVYSVGKDLYTTCIIESQKRNGNMKLYFDQIPKGSSTEDYPPNTKFILDDTRPKRDPVTFKLIRKPKRELIYPEDCKPPSEETEHMKTVYSVLTDYLHKLNQYQARLLRKDNGSNTEDILFLYRYLEETRTMTEDASDVYKALRIYRLRLTDDKVSDIMEKYGIDPDIQLV